MIKQWGDYLEFVLDYIVELLIAVGGTIAVFLLTTPLLRAHDKRNGPEANPRSYSVYIPVEGRRGILCVAVFALIMGALLLAKATTEGMILGVVSLVLAVVMLTRTLSDWLWRVTVHDGELTSRGLLQKTRSTPLREVSALTKTSRGYNVYRGSEKLFDFTPGTEKNNPAAHRLLDTLREETIHE